MAITVIDLVSYGLSPANHNSIRVKCMIPSGSVRGTQDEVESNDGLSLFEAKGSRYAPIVADAPPSKSSTTTHKTWFGDHNKDIIFLTDARLS